MKISEMTRDDLENRIDAINRMLAPYLKEIGRRNFEEIDAIGKENAYRANCKRCGRDTLFDRSIVHLAGEVCARCTCN